MKRITGAVAVALMLASCSSSEAAGDSVSGIVVEVDGDLETVRSFTIVDESGIRFVFIPSDGLTFHGTPLSHLSSHVVSGVPVYVEYEEGDGDGEQLVALFVEDG